MAVKSLYFKNVVANAALSLQDGGTAPTGAITTTGWAVAKIATANFSLMAVGSERTSGTFSTTDALTTPTFSAGSCWRSENPFSGAFANTNWSLAFRVRAVSAASAQTGRVKCRIWKSTNAAGTGATELTSAILTGTTTTALSTSASVTSTVTWTPGGVITLTAEYLWVQCEWNIVVASGSNSGDVDFYVESAGVITTPDFAAIIDGDLVLAQAAQTIAAAGAVVVGGTLGATQAANTLAAAGGPVVRGTLTVSETSDAIAAVGNVVIAGGLNVVEASDALSATGDVAAAAISGALAATQANQALTGAGSVAVVGTLTVSQPAQTISATGAVISGVNGALNITQAAEVLFAAGSGSIHGTLVLTQPAQTLSATGLLVLGGIFNDTQANQALIAAGSVAIDGTLNVTQASETLSATAAVIVPIPTPVKRSFKVATENRTAMVPPAARIATIKRDAGMIASIKGDSRTARVPAATNVVGKVPKDQRIGFVN